MGAVLQTFSDLCTCLDTDTDSKLFEVKVDQNTSGATYSIETDSSTCALEGQGVGCFIETWSSLVLNQEAEY